ncbi:MAG: restriction endonuclease subunit S [Flavobacterium sp.]|nr:restriction endonuclease subunit S [Flavobacterium sp.]
MSLQPYKKYNSIAYDYARQLPDGWELWKIAHAFNLIGSGTTPQSGNLKFYENGTINWINTGDLNDGVLKSCKNKITEEAFKKHSVLKIYPKGTLLVAMYGATIGKAAVMDIDGCTNQACCALSKSKILTNKFTLYWFIANRKNIANLSYGGGQPNISQDVIKKLKIPVPPIEVQNSIVAYLDKKNEQIDTFIRNKERLVELLEEELSHFILEKVSNSKTGWENKKIKYASKVFRGKFTHRPRNDESLYDGEYPFIQTGDVARASKYITKYSQTLNKLGYKVTTEFPKGTIVMTIAANIGDVAILGFNACFPDSVIGFYPKKNVLNDFLYYALKIKKDDFLQTAIVNTQMNLNVERVSSIFIDIPPFSEQQNIVYEIEEHEKYIQNAISKAQQEISSIKEYREALITDLVTGKRSVPQLQMS